MGDEVDNSTPTEDKETEPATTTTPISVNGDHNGDSHADLVTTDNDDVAESNDETTNNESSDDTPAKKNLESGGEEEPKNGVCIDSADDAEMSEGIVDSQDEDMLEEVPDKENDRVETGDEGDTNEEMMENDEEAAVEMSKALNNDVVHSLTDTEDDSEGEVSESKNNTHLDDEASSQSASKVQEIHDDDPIPLDDSDDDEATNASKRTRIEETLEKSAEEPQAKKLKTTTTNGSVGSPDVEEILSDKEDVIVIEDAKNNDLLSPRRSGRQRTNVVKVRDFANYDDDIEEVPADPLTVSKQKSLDSIKLAASGASLDIQQQIRRQTEQFQKKQQETLTIIDTNTLLANRNNNKSLLISQQSSPKSAQNMYNINMRATISPVTPKVTAPVPPLLPVTPTSSITSTSTQLLPDLSDDMFVLEAPSFIVPYIYEKPPSENLRDTVSKIEAMLEEIRKKRKALKGDESNEESSQAEDSLLVAETTSDEKKTPPPPSSSDKKDKKKKNKRYAAGDDDSWDENDASTDDEASDSENRTKVLIKDVQDDIESIKEHIITPNSAKQTGAASANPDATKKSTNYFESPIGKFFMDIGINAVQQYVQTDLLRQLKRKKAREEKANTPSASTMTAINSLMKNLEVSKENNKPFKFALKRCEYCSFKTESALAMAYHYETPHLIGMMYKCNFCEYESRPAHEILYHMEAIHNIKGRIEKTLSYHQCPNCTFEDNGKSKLARHSLACVKKFKPETNLAPYDWDPPGKLRLQSKHGLIGTANAYQALAAQQAAQRQALAAASAAAMTASSRINPAALANQRKRLTASAQAIGKPMTSVLQGQMAGMKNMSQNMRWQLENSNRAASFNQQVLQQMARGGNISMAGSLSIQQSTAPGPKSSKTNQQPSVSITPLPRGIQQTSAISLTGGAVSKLPSGVSPGMKPGQNPNATNKTSFVICEICDGYIKDLDQLRNHMQWIHKVKIHPKMIYNRPPLNCQKCQFRFFTDQGLERHLLGSHGLVTSSMQEAANQGKDAGRCPICGMVYQRKLLNHVSRDHNMTLKPAHLSYKCTVCTATFGMYKQFESHVYSAHSTVAKKAMDAKKQATSTGRGGGGGSSMLKPVKINDEITIIPQPATKSRNSGVQMELESHVID